MNDPSPDVFDNSALRRLAISDQDYQRKHGHYIVPLAERLLRARDLAEYLFGMCWDGSEDNAHAEAIASEIASWTRGARR